MTPEQLAQARTVLDAVQALSDGQHVLAEALLIGMGGEVALATALKLLSTIITVMAHEGELSHQEVVDAIGTYLAQFVRADA